MMEEIESREDGSQQAKSQIAKIQENFNERQRQGDDARMKLKAELQTSEEVNKKLQEALDKMKIQFEKQMAERRNVSSPLPQRPDNKSTS